MRAAIDQAGLETSDIAYVNAHGTATLAGDIAETKAMKVALGEHAEKLMMSSSKSMIGHCSALPGRSRRSPRS